MKTARKFIVLFIIACLALCSSAIAGCSNFFGYDEAKCKQRFETRFNLELPATARLVCYLYETTREGRDEYFVWQFEVEPSQILNEEERYTKFYSAETGEEAEQIKQYFKKAVKSNIEGLFSKAPEQFRPNWDCDYLVAWRDYKSYSTYTEIEFGPSYYYNIEQKLLIGWKV